MDVVNNIAFSTDNIVQGLEDFNLSISSYFKDRSLFIQDIQKEFKNWVSSVDLSSTKSEKLFLSSAEFYRIIERMLGSEEKRLREKFLFDAIQKLQLEINNLLDPLEISFDEFQEPEHFNASESDNSVTKGLKIVKRISFSIDRAFRKNKVDYKWKRRVLYQNITKNFFEISLLSEILKSLNDLLESYGESLTQIVTNLKRIDQRIIADKISAEIYHDDLGTFEDEVNKLNSFLDELISNINSYPVKLNETISESLIIHENNYRTVLKKAGTVECPPKEYNDLNLNKKAEKFRAELENSFNQYARYFGAVFDKVEYYYDTMWFTYLMLGSFHNQKRTVTEYSNNTIDPLFRALNDLLVQSEETIKSGNSNLINVLKNEREKLFNNIDKKLTNEIMTSISENDLFKTLLIYHNELTSNLDEFAREYLFVNTKNLDYGLEQSQIKKFSPKEIISTTVIKELGNSIQSVDEVYNQKINKLSNKIIGIGRVAEYNISSAITKSGEKDTTNESCINIAESGIKRARNKSKELLDDYYKIVNETYTKIEITLNVVVEQLVKFTNTEQLLRIKLQVSKEKTVMEIKENVKTYLYKLKVFKRWLSVFVSKEYGDLRTKISGITSRVGLTQGASGHAEATANYLLQINSVLDQLPYVYQQLFSNEQIFDERIFVGREDEIERLKMSFEYWDINSIGSTILVGEKGSGTSSLINIFMPGISDNYKIYRKEFSHSIYLKEDLEKALSKLLTFENTLNVEKIIERLNSSPHKIVVIMENLEDFYIRRIDGFEVLKIMFEIISATQANVLWIATCNLYTWNYLVKVININDYFSFTIMLNELDVETTKEIILKRHNISGYDLEFIVPEEVLKQKAYIKLDEIARQEYLQSYYFEKLMKLSSDNIAIALFLWLRSIKNIDEEKIFVSSDISLDVGFLKNLSDDKLFTLVQMVLHDGLSYSEHSIINNCSIEKSKLLFSALKDDGIIFKRKEKYKVNFYLYRPVVSLLKAKNILH